MDSDNHNEPSFFVAGLVLLVGNNVVHKIVQTMNQHDLIRVS